MKDLKKYNEMKEEKIKEMKELTENVQVENRAMTEDENNLFDELEKEVESINNTIEKLNKTRKLTEDSTDEDVKEKGEERNMNIEERDLQDFGEYIRNEILEKRNDTGFSQGSNGIIIPTTIANKIITTAFNISPVLSMCTVYNTKGKLNIPVYGSKEDKDIEVAYEDEFQDIKASAGGFSSVTLQNFAIGVLTKISNSLIANTDLDIANIVINLMAEKVKMFLEREILIGTENKITGCSDITKVQKTVAEAITYDDLIKLKNQVIQSKRKGSVYIMNQDTATIVELIRDENGNPLFKEDPTGEFDGKICGYPVYISDSMPDVKTGEKPIIFGNFTGVALKKSKELEIQMLRELYAVQNATGIVAWLEADAKIEDVQKIAVLEIAGE